MIVHKYQYINISFLKVKWFEILEKGSVDLTARISKAPAPQNNFGSTSFARLWIYISQMYIDSIYLAIYFTEALKAGELSIQELCGKNVLVASVYVILHQTKPEIQGKDTRKRI